MPPAFDGQRAYGYLKAQCDLGPRVPGTAAWQACQDLFARQFDSLGYSYRFQRLTFTDPYTGRDTPLVNIIVTVPGTDSKLEPLLFAAHYDSRPRTDNAIDTTKRKEPLLGANDGASGAAVLLELARVFKQRRPAAAVDLVFLDAEDWGREGDLQHYSLGAQALARSGIKGKFRFGIVIDMIGDKDQQIYRDQYSDTYAKPIDDMVWRAAKKLNVTTFKDSVKYSVIDDHLPINVGGVPCIDLIDFDYPYWHTEQDTPDKCSPEALANVGRVLAYISYNPSLWPKK